MWAKLLKKSAKTIKNHQKAPKITKNDNKAKKIYLIISLEFVKKGRMEKRCLLATEVDQRMQMTKFITWQ